MLNLQPQYEFFLIEDNKYSFSTNSGVIYTAYFICSHEGLDIYSFCFDKSEEYESRPDEKIKNTILNILYLFFEKNDGAIIYVCDSSDGREESRKRLFSQWFEKYNDSTLMIKPVDVKNEEINILSSIIMKKDCLLKNEVIQFFDEQMQLLSLHS